MKLEDFEKPLTDSEFKDFESKIKLELPESFVSLYKITNGGFPTHPYYKSYYLSFFAPIKYGDAKFTIESLIKNLNEVGLLPQGYLPFANDSGGWYFCLDLNETNYGSVYVIRNDMADESPVFVAPSFKEFIENLSIEDNW